jgi:hypothetical protein
MSAPVYFTVNTAAAQAPTASTSSATSVSSTGGTFNGTVNPNGLSTSVWFQWGTTTALGQTTNPGTITGTTAVPVNSTLSGASPNTTYYFRVAAQSSAGTTYGSTLSFTTSSSAQAPTTPIGLAPGGSSSPGQTVTTLTPTLTWNVSAGATSYSVVVLTASNAAVFSQNVTTNSLQIPSGHLTSGTTYVWALTANNSAGSSAMSAPVYFTVVAAAPSISYIYPTTMTASTTALTTLYVYGANFSTSGGQLEFLDPSNTPYSSNSHPERVVTVISTEWVYNLNNGGTTGTWHVRVVNADSQASSWIPFVVQ